MRRNPNPRQRQEPPPPCESVPRTESACERPEGAPPAEEEPRDFVDFLLEIGVSGGARPGERGGRGGLPLLGGGGWRGGEGFIQHRRRMESG